MREKIIAAVQKKKIVAIVRGLEGESCIKLAQALYEGGVESIEVTFNMKRPDAFHVTADAIRGIIREMGGCMNVGAGTEPVLNW